MKKLLIICLLISIVFIQLLSASCTCNHNYEETITSATCDKVGSIVKTCTKCGDVKKDFILATGHEVDDGTILIESTCKSEGLIEGLCEKCGKTVTVSLPKLEHTYESYHQEADCENDGIEGLKCKVCEDIQVQSKIDKLGHQIGEYTVVEYATCTKEGIKEAYCKRCSNKVTTSIKKVPHNLLDYVQEAKCEIDGYTCKKCSNCEYTENMKVIDKLGHDYSSSVVIEEVTPEKDGIIHELCSRCEEYRVKTVLSTSYLDMSILKMNYEDNTLYDINNIEDLKLLFMTCVFNKYQTLECNLLFEVANFNEVMKYVSSIDLGVNFSSNSKLVGNKLTIQFAYQDSVLVPTINPISQAQFNSMNYFTHSSTRSSDYNDFPLLQNSNEYNAEDSDQLVYLAERRMKIVPKASSKAESVFEQAKSLLRTIVDNDMTDIQKALAIHDYLVMNVTYDTKVLNESVTLSEVPNYKSFHIEGVFEDGLAVCDGISKAYSLLLNLEGIPAIRVTGKSKDGVGHAWNKVYLDNKWYIIDVTSDNLIVGNNEVLSHSYFMIDDETYNKKYIPSTGLNIVCNDKYDIYDAMNYNETIDYSVTSYEDLVKTIRLLKNIELENITFELSFTYLSSKEKVLTDISKAFGVNGLNISYQYCFSDLSTSGNYLFTFIFQ